MVQIKWLGKQDTLIRQEANGAKVEVKAGGIVDVTEEQAIFYTRLKEFERVTAEVKPEKIEKAAVKKVGKKADPKSGIAPHGAISPHGKPVVDPVEPEKIEKAAAKTEEDQKEE